MADWHTKSLAHVLEALGSTSEGLTAQAAKARLAEIGRNELKVSKDTPEVIKFLLQFKNFFAILLLVGGALAMTAEQLAELESKGII